MMPPRVQSLPRILLLAALAVTATPLQAQTPSPNQPEAIRARGLSPAPCPLIVPKQEAALQPLRIWPDQVKGKNAMGCLSPADASLYGPDGCPLKLCTISEGTMTLPPL